MDRILFAAYILFSLGIILLGVGTGYYIAAKQNFNSDAFDPLSYKLQKRIGIITLSIGGVLVLASLGIYIHVLRK